MADLIDRRAAIDAVSEYATIWMSYTDDMSASDIAQEAINSAKDTMIRILKEQPTVQPDHNADIGKKVDGDCISRQEAIDALEKVAELFPWRVPGNRDSYDRYNEAWNDAIGRAEIEIEKLPSAQPEIIRCKDCKHYLHDEEYGFDWCNRMSGVFRAKPDGFCSWADMRGGDSNE